MNSYLVKVATDRFCNIIREEMRYSERGPLLGVFIYYW